MSNPPARRPRILLGWLRGYDRSALAPDLLAGLTTAAVALPKTMAYATVAGLPVQIGLYAALAAPIVYALVGRSPVLSVTTTATLGILTGSALAEAVPGADAARLFAATASLSILVGLILLAAAALRLGFVASFISEPVLAGFKAGIGAVIIVDQLPKLLGIHIEKTGFIRDLGAIVKALPGASIPTVLLSAAAVLTIVALKHWRPRFPAALVVVALSIAATVLFQLPSYGIKTFAAIPSGLPSLVRPDFGLFGQLWPAALAIALMSFTETIAAGRAFAVAGQPRPAPNPELFATGLGNVAGGLIGAMPSGGGTTQTLVQSGGARTQLAGLVVGGATLATLFLFAPAVSHLPQAVLAAIVIVYSVELVSLREFRAIAAVRRTEFVWALTAFVGVLLLGTLRGILVAVVTSFVALARQAVRPAVYELVQKPGTDLLRRRSPERPEDEALPGLLMVRVEGRLFFGNADYVLDHLQGLLEASKPRVLALDCSAILDLEYSALKMLDEAATFVRGHGATLWLTALNPDVRRVVERSPLGKEFGPERTFHDLSHAIAHYRSLEASSPPPA